MSVELKRLERQLTNAIMDDVDANRERIHALIKKFLLGEAVRMTGRSVKDEADITDTIRVYAKSVLLQQLVEKPGTVTHRKLEEMLVGSKERREKKNAGLDDIFASLPGAEKAALYSLAARAELAKGDEVEVDAEEA